jgi:hypothetical protein
MFYLMKLCKVQGIVAFCQLFQIQNVRVQTECEAEFHTAVNHEIYSDFQYEYF